MSLHDDTVSASELEASEVLQSHLGSPAERLPSARASACIVAPRLSPPGTYAGNTPLGMMLKGPDESGKHTQVGVGDPTQASHVRVSLSLNDAEQGCQVRRVSLLALSTRH